MTTKHNYMFKSFLKMHSGAVAYEARTCMAGYVSALT